MGNERWVEEAAVALVGLQEVVVRVRRDLEGGCWVVKRVACLRE